MLRFSSLLILLAAFQILEANEALAPSEADAIIAEREAAKAERKAARLAELEQAIVISEGRGALPDGRAVIVREVVPPVLPESAFASAEPTAAGFTEEPRTWLAEQQQLQSHKVQMLSCTVYDRSITEVRWSYEGEDYLAYTNADFNYLCGLMTVSTETDRYDYFFAIGNVSSDQMAAPLPVLPAFSPNRSEYVLIEGDSINTTATAGLEALLAHYDANLDSLKVAYQRSEALTAAQKRYDARHPKKPEDFIMQFWVPEKKGTK